MRIRDLWTPRRSRFAALAFVLAVGVGLRLFLLLRWPRRLNGDEATVSLIALHILRGEFPVFFYSNAYMGTPEAYLTAVVYALVGASPLSAKVAVFLLSCFFIAVVFLVGKRLGGWSGGLCAAALAAVAPPFLPLFGNYPMLGYVEVIVVGSLVLLLALDLADDDVGGARRARRLFVFGLVAGLGWWINPLIASQVGAAAIFLLLRPPLWSASLLWVPAGFGLGSLPFWVFNLTHGFWSFVLFRKGAQGELAAAPSKLWPPLLEILGIEGVFTEPVPVLSRLAGVVYLTLLAILLVDLAGWPVRPPAEARLRRRGVVLLLLVSALHLVAFGLSGYGGVQRYLFPLYSTLFVLVALACLRLAAASRWLAVSALALLLLNDGLALVKTVRIFDAGLQADWWRPEPVVALLERERLTRAYADLPTAPRLTFETTERIVVAEPIHERYPPYRRWVDGSPRVAYILSPRLATQPLAFESSLRGIGAAFRRADLGEFTVFHDFRPPAEGALASIPPVAWRADSDPAGTGPARAFDRDVDTAWFSGSALAPGMWYRLDLGRIVQVAGITVLPVRTRLGIPRGYRIELSADGSGWAPVASVPEFAFTLAWREGQPRMDQTGQVVSRFPPRPARYVRIVQTGRRPDRWWAIAEIFVYGVSPGPPGTRAAALTHLSEGVRLERAGRWASALAAHGKAVQIDPELEEAHWRMAEVYAQVGLPTEGSDPVRRVLILERLGLWRRAAAQYESLVPPPSAEGDHSEPLRRLATLYRRGGDTRRADELERRLRAEYTPPVRAEARFGRSVRLLGYGLEPREARAGAGLALSYYWEALAPIEENATVFVHFVRDGKIRFTQDHEPLHGRHPTSQWRAGERVRETYRVPVPDGLAAGEYEIWMGLWNPASGRRMRVDETALTRSRDAVRVGTVRLLPAG